MPIKDKTVSKTTTLFKISYDINTANGAHSSRLNITLGKWNFTIPLNKQPEKIDHDWTTVRAAGIELGDTLGLKLLDRAEFKRKTNNKRVIATKSYTRTDKEGNIISLLIKRYRDVEMATCCSTRPNAHVLHFEVNDVTTFRDVLDVYERYTYDQAQN